jgi:hypothetical protein
LIAGGIEVVGRLLRFVPPEAWAAATAGLAVFLLLRHPTATVRPPLPPDAALFTRVGNWIRGSEPDPVLHSAHPFASLALPSVPAARFDDFGTVREDTLRAAPDGAWVLVEDRFYSTHRPPNPGEADLARLGFKRIPFPVAVDVTVIDLTRHPLSDGVDLSKPPDPRHDPSVADMRWALWKKLPR